MYAFAYTFCVDFYLCCAFFDKHTHSPRLCSNTFISIMHVEFIFHFVQVRWGRNPCEFLHVSASTRDACSQLKCFLKGSAMRCDAKLSKIDNKARRITHILSPAGRQCLRRRGLTTHPHTHTTPIAVITSGVPSEPSDLIQLRGVCVCKNFIRLCAADHGAH